MKNRPLCVAVIATFAAYAFYIHAAFIHYIPDPIFSPDSGTYAGPALNLFFGKPFALSPERTPCYSFFLYLALRLTRSFTGVLIIQHGLAVATGLMAGVIYYRFVRPSCMGAACVAFFSSSLPLPALYAHYILTETLYTFLLVGAALLVLHAHGGRRREPWILAGLAIGILVLTRPVGRSFLIVLCALPFLDSPGKRPWRALGACMASALSILVLFAFWNYAHFGFFGLDRMKNIALFCTTARYLDAGAVADPKVRAILTPIYARHAAELADGSWVYASSEGPVKTLSRSYTPSELDDIYGRLTVDALKRKPFRFLIDRLAILRDFFTDSAEIPRYYLMSEASYFVYQGLDAYGQFAAAADPRAWTLLRYGPPESAAYFAQMHFVPTGRPSGMLPYIPRSAGDRVYHYGSALEVWRPLAIVIRHMRVLPFFALLGSFALALIPADRYAIAVLALVIGLHAAVTALAAWQDWRFVVPILPFYVILFIGGCELLWSTLRLKQVKSISA